MSNALSEEKKQQVIALGKLGWALRRIEQATGAPCRERCSPQQNAAATASNHKREWTRPREGREFG